MIKVILALTVVVSVVLSVIFVKNKNSITQYKETDPLPSEVTSKEYTAEFKIITNGTTRIFTDEKYHNQSLDVYIDPENTSTVIVKRENITWSDFFGTLPMSLDKNCLVTGTKQTFCTNKTQKLRFYINNIEDPDALDKVIKNKDSLLVTFD